MRISLCLLLFSVVHGGGYKEIEVAAVAGKSVQLQPMTLSQSWTEITWKFTLDLTKTIRILTFNKYKIEFGAASDFTERINFYSENLSLQIDPVKKSDSGVYTLLIDTGGGHEDIRKFRVSVCDPVGKPNLTLLSAHLELGRCNVTLSCSVPDVDEVTYSWSQGMSLTPSDRALPLPERQSQLRAVINADSNETFFRCNASNQASWGVNTVDVKTPCSPQAAGPAGIFDVVPLWVLGPGVGVFFLLVLPLICLCKYRKRQRSCRDIDQTPTVYEEVNDACTRRNSTRTAPSGIIGNTIYAEVNCNLPPEGPAPRATDLTVYASVQRPRSIKKPKINPALLATVYMEVQETPSRPKGPQKPRSSSPNPGHVYS